MRISDINILLVDGDEVLKAFVSIKIDNCLVIRDMKVISGNNGYFVAMPAKKMKDGTYWDLVHPLDRQTRELLEERVLSEYNRVCKGAGVVEGNGDQDSESA